MLNPHRIPAEQSYGYVGRSETTGKARQGVMPSKTKFSTEEALNLNPYHNLVLAKEIADFVNTATGHGPLRTHYCHSSGQIDTWRELLLRLLRHVLFSPGLLALAEHV